MPPEGQFAGAVGRMEPSTYLQPLTMDSQWGRAIIALATAFGTRFTFNERLVDEGA